MVKRLTGDYILKKLFSRYTWTMGTWSYSFPAPSEKTYDFDPISPVTFCYGGLPTLLQPDLGYSLVSGCPSGVLATPGRDPRIDAALVVPKRI